jgi:Adenylate and Guanylate cyclase catalytic domain
MTTCAACGQDNPAGFNFCGACGASLGTAGAREERKVVTVLFADLVGFTARAEQTDPEDVRALLVPYHAHVREELERYGGTVEKFPGDAVMALFGAPVAHENDPERAVRAAISIRDWAREQEGEHQLRLRIALNTGEALVALGSRPEAGEGMASGDVGARWRPCTSARRSRRAALKASTYSAPSARRSSDGRASWTHRSFNRRAPGGQSSQSRRDLQRMRWHLSTSSSGGERAAK